MSVKDNKINLRAIKSLRQNSVIAHNRNASRLEILNTSRSFEILHRSSDDARRNPALPQQSRRLCAVVERPAIDNRLGELLRGDPLSAVMRRPCAMRFRNWNLGNRWAQKTLNRQAINVRPVDQIRKPAVTQSDPINAVRSRR